MTRATQTPRGLQPNWRQPLLSESQTPYGSQVDTTIVVPGNLGGFLGVLCVLAVNAELQFNRQVAKDAKKTPSEEFGYGHAAPGYSVSYAE